MNKKLYKQIEQMNCRSAYERGVQEQALELVEQAEVNLTKDNLKKELLNGAENWREYSYSGNALIYDIDIAERYCNPSELKRKRGGALQPNKHDSWLDVQTRALYNAYLVIKYNITKEG